MKSKLFLSLSLLSLSLQAADGSQAGQLTLGDVNGRVDTVAGELGGLRDDVNALQARWGGAESLEAYFNSKKEELKGDQGDHGAIGPKGEDGAAGLQGPIGPQGDRGDDGKDGARGAAGLQGPIGPQGDRGDDGKDGDKGDMADLTAQSMMAAFTAENNAGLEQLMSALLNGSTGRKFMASFIALKARETEKSVGRTRRMKEEVATDAASADVIPKKKKAWGGSLRRKGSKKGGGTFAVKDDSLPQDGGVSANGADGDAVVVSTPTDLE